MWARKMCINTGIEWTSTERRPPPLPSLFSYPDISKANVKRISGCDRATGNRKARMQQKQTNVSRKTKNFTLVQCCARSLILDSVCLSHKYMYIFTLFDFQSVCDGKLWNLISFSELCVQCSLMCNVCTSIITGTHKRLRRENGRTRINWLKCCCGMRMPHTHTHSHNRTERIGSQLKTARNWVRIFK